ncbi:MAG TPA: M23 family metallopeptidase [Steroidobacteraceae bacterium]|jgi:murein DD-endopeptidase MepM/ murein hydrolase activator NlpD|nr:M23 family metallopeptidase [Steroidobacteraceae bacterium]
MGRTRLAALAAVLSANFFAGCATVDQKFGDQEWYQKSKVVSTKAVEVTSTTAAKAYSRMQKYLAEKDVLKTFQDAGEHSEIAVLGILHKSGIAKTPVAPPAGTQAPPKKHAAPAPLTTVPEQYAGSLRWPLDAYIVSSEYGDRWGKMHKGMDMAADAGEPVYAIAAGEVIYAGDGLRGYGNVVILRHDRKTSSLYAHNSELKVKQGEQVAQGALIALLGSTGHSTGPHVHFEIRDGDTAVNPRTVLPKSKVAEAMDENTATTKLARNR